MRVPITRKVFNGLATAAMLGLFFFCRPVFSGVLGIVFFGVGARGAWKQTIVVAGRGGRGAKTYVGAAAVAWGCVFMLMGVGSLLLALQPALWPNALR
jgi:hypothetical protein